MWRKSWSPGAAASRPSGSHSSKAGPWLKFVISVYLLSLRPALNFCSIQNSTDRIRITRYYIYSRAGAQAGAPGELVEEPGLPPGPRRSKVGVTYNVHQPLTISRGKAVAGVRMFFSHLDFTD